MLVFFHVYLQAAEGDPFTTEAKPLFDGMFATKLDSPSRADNSLPGQARRAVESPHHLASGPGIAGGGGNRAVGRNFAAGHAANGLSYFVLHQTHGKRG